MSSMIAFFLCGLFHSLFSTALSVQECTTLNHIVPSLYEQYCCVEDNRGKSFILSDNKHNKFQYIMCPHGTPASCSSIDFYPSCSAILTSHPTATSGYYNIMLANGTVSTVYCDMEGVNCDGEGGWMRVGYLNMSDPSEKCPPGFRLYEVNETRACGREENSPSGCTLVEFPCHSINYTQVCGRVTGYQKGLTRTKNAGIFQNMSVAYTTGVSITRGVFRSGIGGSDVQEHIWSFLSGLSEGFGPTCGCTVRPELGLVGLNYYCESGSPSFPNLNTLYVSDPLWDGQGCNSLKEEPCCNVTGIPWFHRVFEHEPYTDYIELRVCSTQNQTISDAPVSHYEIYIK